jgi:hypothetical protein
MEMIGKYNLALPRVVVDNINSNAHCPGVPTSVWQLDKCVWRRETNTSHVRIRNSGHLVPLTVPDDLGRLSVYAIWTAC